MWQAPTYFISITTSKSVGVRRCKTTGLKAQRPSEHAMQSTSIGMVANLGNKEEELLQTPQRTGGAK